MEGQIVSLNDLMGTITVIIYLNFDQDPSREALKDVQGIYSRYKTKDVRVIGVMPKSKMQRDLMQLIKDYSIEFPILLDPARNIYNDLDIRVYPSTIIVDREGKVTDAIPGHALSYKTKIEGAVRYMLGEIDIGALQNILLPVKEHRDRATIQAERRYNLALKLIEMGLVDQAMNTASLAIDAKPDMVPARTLLGFLYLADKDAENALLNFAAALNTDPESQDAKTGMGGALIMKGEIERAVEILSDAVASDPESLMAQYHLGRAYGLEGQLDSSIDIYKKVLQKIAEKHVLPASMARCE
jgi:peroxiredoxin